MPVRSVVLFIGFYFVFGKAADPEYAKLGGTITLIPTVTGQMDEILWTHKGNKVVKFDGRQNMEFKSFVGRTVLDFVTGELTISALTAEDSGQYQLEAQINNHLKYSIHEVKVVAEVAQPTIICEVNDTKTASMATLQCNADRQDQQSPITYNWERLEDTSRGSASTDQKLSISVKDRHDEAVFQCSVSNFVSKKQAQFQVKNCFTDKSTALAVGLSMLFLIILLIILGLLFYYRRHRKAKPAENMQDDVEVPLVQGETRHQKQPDTDNMGQTGLLENRRNPTQLGSEPEAIKNMDETNTILECEVPAEGHHTESSESFSTSPGGEEGNEDGLNDTEKGMETRDVKTEEKTNDEGIVEDVMDQNGEEAIVKAEQEKDLSVSETLNSKEDQIAVNTPDAVAVPKPAELSQVQPESNNSQADRDVDLCQQPKARSPSSTSLGELVGSERSNEAEEGMEAGGEKKPEGGDDTSLGMDRSMETKDAENKKSAEDVGNMEQPSMKEEKVGTDESEDKSPDKGEKANVSSPVEAVGMDVKNANIEQDVKKDKGGIKVDSQMEVAGSDEQGETRHQKQPDTDKMGQTGLLENRSNPTQLGLKPEAIKNMLETNTESKSEGPAKGHQVENNESFSTSPGEEEGNEDGLNDTETGMETRDVKTEQKTNDEGIVEDVMDQNGKEAIVKAEQEKDLSVSETLNSKEDQIAVNTPDAVAVPKPAELSQVQPESNNSKAEREVDLCQQPKARSSSSTSLGELVGSERSNEAEEGMEAGGEKKPEGGDDTSLGMDRRMETKDTENKKSAEDVGNMEQPSMKEEKVGTDESEDKSPDKGEKANVSSPVEAVGMDVKNANIEQDVKKDKGGVKVDSQMEVAGSDEQGETRHQKQPDTDKMGQTGLLENQSNPTQLGLKPEAIKNMLETNTESKSEGPPKGHQVENYESFSTSPGGEEGNEDGLNDTEKGMEKRDVKTEQKTNDEGIVKDIMDQNGEEAILKAEQEKDLSVSETLNSKEDQIAVNTPDAVAVPKPAELSQVQPESNNSKAERDVDLCQQPKARSSSSTSLGELVGSERSNEAEEGMEAGGEKEPEGGDDTSLGMDRSMETKDAENKKSAEDVGNMEQPSMKEEKVGKI